MSRISWLVVHHQAHFIMTNALWKILFYFVPYAMTMQMNLLTMVQVFIAGPYDAPWLMRDWNQGVTIFSLLNLLLCKAFCNL